MDIKNITIENLNSMSTRELVSALVNILTSESSSVLSDKNHILKFKPVLSHFKKELNAIKMANKKSGSKNSILDEKSTNKYIADLAYDILISEESYRNDKIDVING